MTISKDSCNSGDNVLNGRPWRDGDLKLLRIGRRMAGRRNGDVVQDVTRSKGNETKRKVPRQAVEKQELKTLRITRSHQRE